MVESWRNLLILIAGWLVWVTADSAQISVASEVGEKIAPDKSWATAMMATQFLGAAIATIPAAALMRYVSRRVGFMCGGGLALVGAALAGYAVHTANFPLYVVATAVIGAFLAFVQTYRFAAAELAKPEFRPRAISLVLASGMIGGLLGPLVVAYLRPYYQVPQVAAYVVYGGVALATILLMSMLSMGKPPAVTSPEPQRSLGAIASQPAYLVGALSAIGSFAVMAVFMAGMPVIMGHHHHHHGTTVWAISGHYFAMYVPALFAGLLAIRFGAQAIIMTGCLLYVACFLVGIFLGIQEMVPMWVFMILLGAGWSFMFIGGTAVVTSTYKPVERAKAQGLHDFLLFGLVALGAAASSKMFFAFGEGMDDVTRAFGVMCWVSVAVTVAIVLANGWLMWVKAKAARAAPVVA